MDERVDRAPQDGDVTQAQLVAELGLDTFDMANIRRDHLASGDWFKHGRGGAVWITPEGQRKLRIWAEVRGNGEQVAHQFLDAIVLRPLPHPMWIKIKILNGNGEWVAKDCLVPRKIKRYMVPRKQIRVEVVQSINGTGYRHEALADYPSV